MPRQPPVQQRLLAIVLLLRKADDLLLAGGPRSKMKARDRRLDRKMFLRQVLEGDPALG
jgi:hypothetical protein